MVIGSWHGDVVGQLLAALQQTGVRVTTSTLPTGESLPDPDCWVRRASAAPAGKIGQRLGTWNASDVLLVVEVSDDTVLQDLGTKAKLYGKAGYVVYWVVTEDVIYEHTEPSSAGYRTRVEYRVGERIPLRYADTDLAVTELIQLT